MLTPTLTSDATAGRPRLHRTAVLLSPLLIILLGHGVAQVWTLLHPPSTWLALALTYWLAMAVVVFLGTGTRQRRAWFGPSRRRWWVIPTALLLGGGTILGILAPNLDLLTRHAGVTLAWLLFAAINPALEEAYWRGALVDAMESRPTWQTAGYTTALFTLSHPLMWGVFSDGNRSPMLYASLVLMGLAWFAIRRATGSLRWAWLSHTLVNVGNLSVFVFLDLYVPPPLTG